MKQCFECCSLAGLPAAVRVTATTGLLSRGRCDARHRGGGGQDRLAAVAGDAAGASAAVVTAAAPPKRAPPRRHREQPKTKGFWMQCEVCQPPPVRALSPPDSAEPDSAEPAKKKRQQQCEEAGCTKQPRWGIPGETKKRRWCAKRV